MIGINTLVWGLLVLFATQSYEVKRSRIETLKLESKIFGNIRDLRVYLPPNYDPNTEYKVLYLNDGQNVFGGANINANNDWRVDEIMDSLVYKKLIRPLIVVGIDNIGLSSRGNEYLPWEDIYLTPPVPNPEGKKYPEFIINEVMPLIESMFKIKPGKENTGIGGFSYGGLIATFTAMTHGEHFGFLLVESPSLYVNNQQLLKDAENSKNRWPNKIYVGVGTNELSLKDCDEDNEDNKMAVNDIQKLLNLIRNYAPNTKVHFEISQCATHSFREASKRLPGALMFLFQRN